MKTVKTIFSNISVAISAAVVTVFAAGVTVPAMAAYYGCDNDSNDRIVPELALCTTHVYNIGKTKNPDTDAERQLMRDIVALKTTVMTQQMYKQYEYMESMLSRFKTQLEKAILTTKLQAAGAVGDGTSTAGSSISSKRGISSAEDCMVAGGTSDVMNCLSRNIAKITSELNSGNIGDAKLQVKTDLGVLKMYDTLKADSVDPADNSTPMSTALAAAYRECNKASSDRRQLQTCVNYIRVCITRNIEDLQNKNRSGNAAWGTGR